MLGQVLYGDTTEHTKPTSEVADVTVNAADRRTATTTPRDVEVHLAFLEHFTAAVARKENHDDFF